MRCLSPFYLIRSRARGECCLSEIFGASKASDQRGVADASGDSPNIGMKWHTTITTTMENHLHNFVSTRKEPLIFRFGMNEWMQAMILFSNGFPCDWTMEANLSSAHTHRYTFFTSIFCCDFSPIRQFYYWIRGLGSLHTTHQSLIRPHFALSAAWTCVSLYALEFTWIHAFVVGSLFAQINNSRNEYGCEAWTQCESRRDAEWNSSSSGISGGEKCAPNIRCASMIHLKEHYC